MNIKVILQDGQEREVKPFQLDKLISIGRVKVFYRSGGWVTVAKDRIRGHGGTYSGPERRNQSTIKLL